MFKISKNRPDDNYDEKQLEMGTLIELEHTNDRSKAREIAKDHLDEISDYYTRLKKMEDEAKNRSALNWVQHNCKFAQE